MDIVDIVDNHEPLNIRSVASDFCFMAVAFAGMLTRETFTTSLFCDNRSLYKILQKPKEKSCNDNKNIEVFGYAFLLQGLFIGQYPQLFIGNGR